MFQNRVSIAILILIKFELRYVHLNLLVKLSFQLNVRIILKRDLRREIFRIGVVKGGTSVVKKLAFRLRLV